MQKTKEVARAGKRMGKKVMATDTAQDVVEVLVDGLEEVVVDKADDAGDALKVRAARAGGRAPKPTTAKKSTAKKSTAKKRPPRSRRPRSRPPRSRRPRSRRLRSRRPRSRRPRSRRPRSRRPRSRRRGRRRRSDVDRPLWPPWPTYSRATPFSDTRGSGIPLSIGSCWRRIIRKMALAPGWTVTTCRRCRSVLRL